MKIKLIGSVIIGNKIYFEKELDLKKEIAESLIDNKLAKKVKEKKGK